jgi:hypothetical protein
MGIDLFGETGLKFSIETRGCGDGKYSRTKMVMPVPGGTTCPGTNDSGFGIRDSGMVMMGYNFVQAG